MENWEKLFSFLNKLSSFLWMAFLVFLIVAILIIVILLEYLPTG